MIPADANVAPHQSVHWTDKALSWHGVYYVSFDTWGRMRAAEDAGQLADLLAGIEVVEIPDRGMLSTCSLGRANHCGGSW